METIILFADSSRGIYIPQHFVESIDRQYVQGVELSVLDELENIEDDNYWDTWQYILDNCKIVKDGKIYSLYQDGDLWLVDFDNASEDELNNLFGEY